MPPSSSELISAVGHPLRRQILNAYLDGALGVASAQELASALDQRVARVAYHLKALTKAGVLRPVYDQDWKRAQEARYALDVEAVWLRLLLEVWAEADLPS